VVSNPQNEEKQFHKKRKKANENSIRKSMKLNAAGNRYSTPHKNQIAEKNHNDFYGSIARITFPDLF
jgi:hypothetical protein